MEIFMMLVLLVVLAAVLIPFLGAAVAIYKLSLFMRNEEGGSLWQA